MISRRNSTAQGIVELRSHRTKRDDYRITVLVLVFGLGMLIGFICGGLSVSEPDRYQIPREEMFYEQTNTRLLGA